VREFAELAAHGVKREAAIDVVTKKHAVSEATLGRYLALVKGKAEHTWLFELCPAYVGRTARAELPAEAEQLLQGRLPARRAPSRAPASRGCSASRRRRRAGRCPRRARCCGASSSCRAR
jgi:hypothetical protein